MKFLLFILVIIDNLNVVLANNDNCGVNDLNALMVRLRQLRTDFNALKTQHEATQAEIKVLKEANRTQETELEELRQDVNNKSLEISKDLEMIKAKCPALWNFFQGNCYYNSNKRGNWLEAEEDCITLGGHLVEITSEEENDFIWSIMRNSVWIGLNETVTENVFGWVSSGNTLGVYTKWATGEPDNFTNQDCVFMHYYTGDWYDNYCLSVYPYICEKESMFA